MVFIVAIHSLFELGLTPFVNIIPEAFLARNCGAAYDSNDEKFLEDLLSWYVTWNCTRKTKRKSLKYVPEHHKQHLQAVKSFVKIINDLLEVDKYVPTYFIYSLFFWEYCKYLICLWSC